MLMQLDGIKGKTFSWHALEACFCLCTLALAFLTRFQFDSGHSNPYFYYFRKSAFLTYASLSILLHSIPNDPIHGRGNQYV
jgi:hypothetical protein